MGDSDADEVMFANYLAVAEGGKELTEEENESVVDMETRKEMNEKETGKEPENNGGDNGAEQQLPEEGTKEGASVDMVEETEAGAEDINPESVTAEPVVDAGREEGDKCSEVKEGETPHASDLNAEANSTTEANKDAPSCETKADIPICKPCNLVFGDDDSLHHHRGSEHHAMVEKGYKPSSGKYFCFLCWRGYGHKLDLFDHYSGNAHEYHVRKQCVKAIWTSLTLTPEEEAEDARRKKEEARRHHERRHDGRRPSDRSRSPLRDSRDSRRPRQNVRDYVSRSERAQMGRGLRHCVECNLVFVSERSETLHRESQRHRAVFEKKRPLAPSGAETPFVCYLCWWGYEEEADLHSHYASTEHVERMRRYGIEKLLKDTREEQDGRRSEWPPACLDDFIILDEVGEEDDDEVVQQKEEDQKIDIDDKIEVKPAEERAPSSLEVVTKVNNVEEPKNGQEEEESVLEDTPEEKSIPTSNDAAESVLTEETNDETGNEKEPKTVEEQSSLD